MATTEELAAALDKIDMIGTARVYLTMDRGLAVTAGDPRKKGLNNSRLVGVFTSGVSFQDFCDAVRETERTL